jgi:hypothetical protein
VLLLLLHRAEASLRLGVVASLLDLALTNRLDARLLLARALLFGATALLVGAA